MDRVAAFLVRVVDARAAFADQNLPQTGAGKKVAYVFGATKSPTSTFPPDRIQDARSDARPAYRRGSMIAASTAASQRGSRRFGRTARDARHKRA